MFCYNSEKKNNLATLNVDWYLNMYLCLSLGNHHSSTL